MSKLVKFSKAQKPEKNRAKNNSLEEFIQATDTRLAINKLILEDMEDIVQNRIVLQSVGEKKTQVKYDPEAKKANMNPGKNQNPAR